jgi:hypothetical protein
MPGYLITYRDSGWRSQMARHEFHDAVGFVPWPDAQNDRLSSFRFLLPVGWDLRIHEHRSALSRCKVWRGTGAEVWVDKAELPSFIHDQGSGHAWARLGYATIAQAFQSLQPYGPADLAFTLSAGLAVPDGARGSSRWHQQGIQRLPSGGWAVSGSAPGIGYLYCADANGTIYHTHCPALGNFNHLGGFQIADGIMAVGYERFENGANGHSRILFFDVRSGIPARLPHLDLERSTPGDTAGAVGLWFIGDRWLLLVANWNAARLDFYRSTSHDLFAPGTRFEATPTWRWSKSTHGFATGSIDDNWAPYQSINLFTQTGEAVGMDRLWFVGTHAVAGDDWADLYALDLSGAQPVITKVANKHVYNSGGSQSLQHAGGLAYDTTAAAFELYAMQAHLGDGISTRVNRWL